MRRLLLLALACCAVVPAPAAATSFRNPVLPQAADGEDSPDPWIFRARGRYWLTYTSSDEIELRSAATLAALADARPRRLWPRAGASEPRERCCQLWAPEIHRAGSRWYLYYAAAGPDGAGPATHALHVLESAGDDPAGPYRMKGRLALPQAYAIDGTVARIGGRWWLLYSGGAGFAPASLWLAPLSNPWTVAGPPLEISRPELPWERVAFAIEEGPEVLLHDGTLNVVYSASWCGTGAYALGLLSVPVRANLLDPATWASAKRPQPIFAADAGAGVFGPGHGSFFSSPDGRESWMVYHATETDAGCFTGGLRTTRAQRIGWNADGTPRLGTPAALSSDLDAPSGDGTVAVQVEDALPAGAGGRRVEDRRLVGYAGVAVRLRGRAGVTPPLRVRIARGGRFSATLRWVDGGRGDDGGAGVAGGRVAVRRLGVVRLRRGVAVLRPRLGGGARTVTLDQLRLERAPTRPAR
ncbi:glycoside hydrolase family 43 protein [Conexibacter sp. JD483]|uniref:glycoside hydrolase family 43 protein n=1 Tax=unclassified Conexibacter TaxID=2627773 RepID=UPI002716E3F4|nr:MULTISPECIES: glycoside hydrolase family 43 protein [unclassified Conexibacter]MDO8188579.1 glycoside hydrolase family 43 protein [Conexibacter sp. CPCC 205706]MDO8201474.1 glycoside hydrolase family 43 protein [Conexibacter sp. CPCC 205762]MDR9372249.1 glycoside hydrolase family 43 protein [Conexibacter sp. JD483]